MLVLVAFAGCQGSTTEAPQTTPAPTTEAPTEAADHVEPLNNQLQIQIETETKGESSAEYVVIGTLDYFDLQNQYNETLKTFGTWSLVNSDPDVTSVAESDYSIVGNEVMGNYYLSVGEICTVTTVGAAYPTSSVTFTTLDLTGTKTEAMGITEFFDLDKLGTAIANGVFEFTNVEQPENIDYSSVSEALNQKYIVNAKELETEYYLSEAGLTLYLGDKTHAEGDYWLLTAPFSALGDCIVNTNLATYAASLS
jgi:hypothetical protein